MTSREIHPAIARLTERYPSDVRSVAGSIAEKYSVAQMTDILGSDESIEYHALQESFGKANFASLRKQGNEEVRKQAVRVELARSAFGYLAELRTLWHREATTELEHIA